MPAMTARTVSSLGVQSAVRTDPVVSKYAAFKRNFHSVSQLYAFSAAGRRTYLNSPSLGCTKIVAAVRVKFLRHLALALRHS